jgi:DNA-binding transcriptional LysR family regulator
MNLAAVDLNLLNAFDALFTERNVSRAAARIGLTQPGMSNALSRLRVVFGDELFVRTPNEMRPTPLARELATPIREGLAHLRSALEKPKPFDPASSRHLFTIGASDNCDFAIAPAFTRLRRFAPNIDFNVVALKTTAAFENIDKGAIELAVGRLVNVPKRFSNLTLYEERCVCVCDRRLNMPVEGLTIDALASMPHLQVWHETTGFVDRELAARGLVRRLAVTVPNFAVVPYALEDSGLIAVVGERIARRFAALPWIAVHELPLQGKPWTVSLVWGDGQDPDPALKWLTKQLRDACAHL